MQRLYFRFNACRPTRSSRKPLMKRILTLAAGLALALSALPVAAKGDAAKGKQLFYTCTGCHGIADYKNAYPTYRVPKVGGHSAASSTPSRPLVPAPTYTRRPPARNAASTS